MFIIIDILLEFIFDDNIITNDVLPFYPEGRNIYSLLIYSVRR